MLEIYKKHCFIFICCSVSRLCDVLVKNEKIGIDRSDSIDKK